MQTVKRIAAVYLLAVSGVVATFFIVNILLVEVVSVPTVWYALDFFMLAGLALGLVYNYGYKARHHNPEPGAAVTRGYLEAHTLFYATVGVAILFLHNWIAFLTVGGVSIGDNHTAWLIWAVVDTGLPIILWATGYRLWRETQ